VRSSLFAAELLAAGFPMLAPHAVNANGAVRTMMSRMEGSFLMSKFLSLIVARGIRDSG
jgi:hypothetical protein